MYVCMYVCMDGWIDGWMDNARQCTRSSKSSVITVALFDNIAWNYTFQSERIPNSENV